MRRAVLATCFLLAPIACLAQDELFVSNSNSNAITVYARTAAGNTPPIRVLTGAATGLSSPSGIAVDLVNDELYVANLTSLSVTVYPRTASGNTAPLRTVSGSLTTLDGPRGISVDPANGEFSVVNRSGFSVTTWARTATGNVAPLRAIRTVMGLSNPWGGLIDLVNDEIAVANNGDFISVFPRLNDGMTPSRVFSGSNTGFNGGPIGIAFDEINDEYVVTTPNFEALGQWGILWFPRTPGGNVSPNRAIGGDNATTRLAGANGVALDTRRGEVFVANSLGNSVAVHSRFLTGIAQPQRLLTGAATLINNPQFVVVTTSLFADGFE